MKQSLGVVLGGLPIPGHLRAGKSRWVISTYSIRTQYSMPGTMRKKIRCIHCIVRMDGVKELLSRAFCP